jgi:Abnormal spindle-like microcephaly-assoc'd, ASPM-SPD-2-Hydin
MSKKIFLALPIVVMELFLFIFAGSAAAASSVTLSPTSVNLGSVNVGSSAQQPIKVTNSTAISVTITSVTVSGNYFTMSGVTAPLVLPAGASATLNVSFAPKAAGAQTGKIAVAGRGLSLDVTLSANGVSSGGTTSISAVPTSAAFGNVPVGSTNSQTFTVTNHGTTTVSVSSEAVSGTGITMSGLADGAQIAGGRSSTFNVAFKPAKTGTITGSASINFSASGKTIPLSVSLSGNGVTATGTLQVSPTAINFGDVSVGHSGSLSLKVSNTGNSALTTSRGTISGSGFSMIGGLSGLTLQPGQSDSVTVVFEPAANGSAAGTISISAGVTTTSVALSGTGTTASSSSPSHSVDLSWGASTSSGVEGYYVERGTTSGGPYSILNSSPDKGTSYVDSTAQSGKEYFYVVVAVNDGGQQSKPSEQVSATIPSP